MRPAENKSIALQWFAAFNEHNVEKILKLYHDNAQHYSPKLKVRRPETLGLIKGKAALRDWWKDAFERIPSLRYEVKKLTADDEQVFMEYVRHADNEEDMNVGEVLQVENGLIVASRVYHG